eukprot:TRINITY_DN19207_c0_g1_i1.p1 TRINITY_DN19207_c0_g1~~TRINITY_DN19207_c0_g1_i1.p1  ORF type:complete len:541 (-),score=186.07 TRINITY_DN19207_c0_g1_i1:191-1813(-)
MPALAIQGERETGEDVRTQNVTAALAIANIVRTTLGPVGLDKMLVDDIGDVTITNDGATILQQLEVEHPAGKVLVELAQMQDQEVGDGTTSVVLLAAELLKRANELTKQKIHPTSIITGYRMACREAVKYINAHLTTDVSTLGRASLVNAAKTSMSSKIIGTMTDVFAEMCVDAVMRIKTVNSAGDTKYPIKAINILKAHGKSAKESQFIEGFALNCTVASQQMPKSIRDAKIALLDFNLQKHRMGLGVNIQVKDPSKIEEIKKREMDITKEKIQLILKAGANVILTTKGIDDLCLKYFVEAGAIAVRRCKKEDLRRIAKATGGKLIISLADLEGGEGFDASHLGQAEEFAQERVADDELCIVRGCKSSRCASIVLRGANSLMLDEMDRSLHDSLCVVQRTLESNAVVPGGGAVEAALSIYLEDFATSLGSREQLAIAEFAEALLVIPKTLSVNAAQDATDLVSKLRAHHYAAQTKADQREQRFTGLNLITGKTQNAMQAGVMEPAISKVKSIKFAVEAAISILRIDDVIRLNPKQQGDH